MAKKQLPVKQTVAQTEDEERIFTIPALQVSVKAVSVEEAVTKANKLVKESK